MRLPRPIKNSLLPLLLVIAAQKVAAQIAPADDFFNGGAQLYISNNIPAALERTEDGLKFYPDDVKLKKLEELLKQQQQQQNQQKQSQQQQSQSQQNSNGQQNQQQSSQQDSQDQKKPDGQKQDQAGQKNEDQQKQSGQQKSEGEKNENGQPVAGQMTQEEAKKLLDAQKGDEQILQMKPQGRPEDQNKTVKDW